MICWSGLGLLLLAAPAEAHPQAAPAPARLSDKARQLLRKRMRGHGDAMSSLVGDVLLLLYDQAAGDAQRIADRARAIERSDDNLQELQLLLDLQEQLRQRALTVVDAGRARDGAALGTAFGALTQTCVHCHAAYLEPPSSRP